MDTIIAEHQLFHAGLNNMKGYLISCLPSRARWGYGETMTSHEKLQFDGSHLCSLVDNFVNEITTHVQHSLIFALESFALTFTSLSKRCCTWSLPKFVIWS